MASIKKLEGKTGTSYKITVTKGRDSSGKQIRHFKTWAPDRPMTARQMEKEARRVAYDFEREIEQGYQADNRQTFERYARYVIELKERQGAARHSIRQYNDFMVRLSPAIGHMKLFEIRPQHLNALYKKLEEPGSRHTLDTAVSKVDLKELIAQCGSNQKAFGKMYGVSQKIMQRACHYESIKRTNAEKIAAGLGVKCADLFDITHTDKRLSPNSIRRLHSFVSCVLAQAEKEMLIPYNPAAKASPPAGEEHDPVYYQPEQIAAILEALEQEPIKWRAMINLFIVTGARRGEIMGLKWSKVDFENRQIKIDTSLSFLSGVGIFEGPTKTKNTRYVGLPVETVALLRKYRAWQQEQQLLNGDRWVVSDYVFTRNTGGALNPSSIGVWMEKFAERHGLPHIHPHAFRHSAASIMIAEGVDIVTVSKMLGHANTSMTTDTYSHMIEDAKRGATECIADVMLRKKKA